MNKKYALKFIIIVVFLGIIGFGYYFLFSNKDKAGNTVVDNTFGWKYPVAKFPAVGTSGQLAYSTIRDPVVVPQGLPVRLKIPIIGVNSIIEDAFITPDGKMDVPEGSVNVAWFALGPHPGEVGSAVIGGHFGIKNGVKFVFYDLDKLKIGNKVYIVDDKGDTLTFQVRKIKSFDRNADATTVFTSEDGLAHLNLITCEGVWNQVNGTYPQRLIVFTDAVLIKNNVVVKVPIVSDINNAPPTTAIPAIPSTSLIPIEKASFTQTIIQSVKSLFITKIDALITISLLISIFFMIFKIINIR